MDKKTVEKITLMQTERSRLVQKLKQYETALMALIDEADSKYFLLCKYRTIKKKLDLKNNEIETHFKRETKTVESIFQTKNSDLNLKEETKSRFALLFHKKSNDTVEKTDPNPNSQNPVETVQNSALLSSNDQNDNKNEQKTAETFNGQNDNKNEQKTAETFNGQNDSKNEQKSAETLSFFNDKNDNKNEPKNAFTSYTFNDKNDKKNEQKTAQTSSFFNDKNDKKNEPKTAFSSYTFNDKNDNKNEKMLVKIPPNFGGTNPFGNRLKKVTFPGLEKKEEIEFTNEIKGLDLNGVNFQAKKSNNVQRSEDIYENYVKCKDFKVNGRCKCGLLCDGVQRSLEDRHRTTQCKFELNNDCDSSCSFLHTLTCYD